MEVRFSQLRSGVEMDHVKWRWSLPCPTSSFILSASKCPPVKVSDTTGLKFHLSKMLTDGKGCRLFRVKMTDHPRNYLWNFRLCHKFVIGCCGEVKEKSILHHRLTLQNAVLPFSVLNNHVITNGIPFSFFFLQPVFMLKTLNGSMFLRFLTLQICGH